MALATILIVEDYKNLREDLAEFFELSGYTIEEAKNGAEALEVLGVKKIDLIISDYEMPTMDGKQLLQTVRASAKFSHLPFIMLSGTSNIPIEEDKQKNFWFLQKPVNLNTLLKLTSKIIT